MEEQKKIENTPEYQAALIAFSDAMRKSNRKIIIFVILMSLVVIFSVYSMFVYFLPEDFVYYFDKFIEFLYLLSEMS